MNTEAIASKTGLINSVRVQLREKIRKVEILCWYLCYRIVTGTSKDNPGKSLNN